jgi:uncharacterized protein YpuA (DUF1002 family)
MKKETISIKMTWVAAMRGLIAVLEHGTDDGKRVAEEELMDLARGVDELNKTRDIYNAEFNHLASALEEIAIGSFTLYENAKRFARTRLDSVEDGTFRQHGG